MKLTLSYGGAFFAAGTMLVAVVYLLVRGRISANTPDPTSGYGRLFNDDPIDARSDFDLTDEETAALIDQVIERQEIANANTMQSVLVWSIVALVLVGLLAIGIGWLMAGRVLRPIDAITNTAQRVADRSLHERINLDGPHDELKRLADTFDDMLARLDRAFEGQRRFVGNASHELKTPLAINRTLIEVAVAGPDPGNRVRNLAENLLAVNARHERLIDGLLTLARTEQTLSDPVSVDLADVVTHVAEQLRPEVSAGGVVLRLHAAPATTLGDAVLLERLVENLITNGIRHNHTGGHVMVRTCTEGGAAMLTVSNTGRAVTSYELPRLFEPFRRGDGRDRVESSKGVGLGLSIVDAVARAHGAVIDAVPQPGGGLRISVEFATFGDPVIVR